MAQRGKVTRFLTSAEDSDKLGGMVDDIRDAMMEYQVCFVLCVCPPSQPTDYARLHYNKISFIKVVSSS